MATLKVKRAASAGASLNYGELAIGNNELYFGDSGNLPVQLEKVQSINTVFINTTAIDVYYRIATIPINTQYKQCIFRLKAYTATGTTTESTITINLAYYSGNYTSQYSGIIANTSHSYNSGVTAENGWVLYYVRVSFDATYGYIDVYKYKTTPITVESQPLTKNDWTWLNETTTTSVSAGTYRTAAVQLGYGLYGNNIYANSSGTASYSNYGVLLGGTISNSTDKTGKWIPIGYVRFDYNSSYLQGRAINVALDLREIDSQTGVAVGDKITVHIQATLGYHANSTAFSTLVPNINLDIEGQTTLSTSDFAMVVTSATTSYQYIYVYLKLKSSNTVYDILPRNRYGWSYNTSYGKTTSYCTFYSTTDSATIDVLPTPVLGSISYATWRSETMNVAKVNSLYIYNEDSLSYFHISGGSEIPNGSLDINTEGLDISFNLGGNLTLANNFSTSGNFPLTLTTSATTNATIPSGTVTLMDLETAQTITAVKTFNAIPIFNGGTSGSSAPFTVDSTFKVSNLNADLLDGQEGSYYAAASSLDSYLPLTAGSTKPLTGDLYHRGSLVCGNGTYDNIWMQFTSQANGNAIYLGAGGLTAIGGGESVSQIKANISSAEESVIYGSDNETTTIAHRFITSLQNGWASRIEAMTILGSGNVGIGTTSPSYTLHLSKASDDARLRMSSTTHWDLISGYTSGTFVSSGGFGIRNSTAGTTDLAITSTGNVGIGTTTPADKLHVNGNILTNENLYLNYDQTAANAKIFFGDGGSSSAHYIQFNNTNQEFETTNDLIIYGNVAAKDHEFLDSLNVIKANIEYDSTSKSIKFIFA